MLNDTTFAFEQHRNTPVRYNRDLMQQTIQAMIRISEIRARREQRFWKNR